MTAPAAVRHAADAAGVTPVDTRGNVVWFGPDTLGDQEAARFRETLGAAGLAAAYVRTYASGTRAVTVTPTRPGPRGTR